MSTAITADTPFAIEDDCYHKLSDDPFETETNWWSFNIPERRIGCWLHAPYYPNRNAVTWRVFVWNEDGVEPAQLAYYRRAEEVPMPPAPDLRDIAFPGGGYSVKMLRPLMDYHVAYRDEARNFALEFEHRGTHPPRRFTPGEAPMMHNPHLDQLGHIVGEMTLRGEKIRIDGIGVRDRTWGPRGGPHSSSQKAEYRQNQIRVLHPGGPRWRAIERERGRGRIQYIFGHADANTGFLGFVRPQDGTADGWSPMNVGWLLRDGVFGHLDKARSRMLNFRNPRNGWSEHMQVEVVDHLGRTMQAEGFAVSRMSETGYGTNALMRWEFDGKVGWGEDQDVWRPDHFVRMVDALRSTR
ncbi:MAG: hypothetical protein AB7Q97_20570 [Gammaproteobacteria bacterium]